MESPPGVGLPPAFQDSDVDLLCQLMALMLDRLTSINDQIPLSPESVSRFHSAAVPHISILDYLRRIVRWTNVEKTCLLIVMHYIDQICARLPHFTISSLTCHRFIITAIALSSKTLCDAFCTNAHYARIGGISTAELADLEREFLFAIDWRLTCSGELLQLYYENLVSHSNNRFFILRSPEPPPIPPSPSHSVSSMESSGSSDISSSPSESRSTSPISSMSVPSQHQDTEYAPSPAPDPAMSMTLTLTPGRANTRTHDHRHQQPLSSVMLIDMTSFTATPLPEITRVPTVEQNMAFEHFQRSLG